MPVHSCLRQKHYRRPAAGREQSPGIGYRDTLLCTGGGVQRGGQEHFCRRTSVTLLYIMLVDQKTGGREYEKLPLAGTLRCGAGHWDIDCDHLPHRRPPVPGGVFADRLRLRLHAEMKEGGSYEDRCGEVPEISERHFEADFQNEGIKGGVPGIHWSKQGRHMPKEDAEYGTEITKSRPRIL